MVGCIVLVLPQVWPKYSFERTVAVAVETDLGQVDKPGVQSFAPTPSLNVAGTNMNAA